MGARHAALMTRGGEVYTWGAGLGGIMGNGTACGSNYPQQVCVLFLMRVCFWVSK